MSRQQWWLAAALCCIGCATQQYSLPMTAAQLTQARGDQALAVYLSQPDASPTVCDLRAPGPHLTSLDRDTRQELFSAFLAGRVPPGIWSQCVIALLRSADASTTASLESDITDAYREAIHDRLLALSPSKKARLEAMQQTYLERDPTVAARFRPSDELAQDLQKALEGRTLGPFAERHATELLVELELEQGRWQGRRVDVALLDGLFQAGDEPSLRRIGNRLADASMRAEAQRRVIRLHIQASRFPEVKTNASTVEERVMATGANAVSLEEHALVRGSLDSSRVPKREVLVEQQLRAQTARLVASAGDRPGLSVLPELPLRGALWLELAGVSGPVTLCAPAKELDPSPCIAPTDVRLESTFASINAEGAVQFVDSFAGRYAVTLAKSSHELVLPINVAGQRIATLEWSLSFRQPENLVLDGATPGGVGPALNVTVDRSVPGRLIYSVNDGGARYDAVVEWADAPLFQVVSQGGRGTSGLPGTPGSGGLPGSDGWSASCPASPGSDGQSGGDGSNGGDGGPGGKGGPGGDIRVVIVGAGGATDDVVGLLRKTVLSQGGAGGPGGSGGSGGSGGQGGSGGSGTTCTDTDGSTHFLAGGSRGFNGRDGSRGADGPRGRPGPAGRVTFVAGTPAEPLSSLQ